MDDLQRFVAAQDLVIGDVKMELARGRKVSHWMWFVFPQFHGLGYSPMAQQYAIRSLEEAKRYLQHPILGKRLLECVGLTLESGKSAEEIFGFPDDLKFRSCLTLFSFADPDEPLFGKALAQFYGGEPDPETVRLIS